MKFITQNLTKCTPRCGIITNIDRLPDAVLNTPYPMLYTKGGNVPHITREVLSFITKDTQIIQVPIVSTTGFYDPLSEFAGTLGDFVGLKEHITCVSVQDPGDITPEGHHLQNNIPIWTKNGKMYLNPDSYMDIIESFQPDMYCLLSDGDTNKGSSKKRISKSLEHTTSFFHRCLERHMTSEKLKKAMIIAPVVGGYCLNSRQRSIEALLKKSENIDGFLIDGLHNNGPEVELLPFEEIKPIIEKSVSLLPEDKMRVIHGCWNPYVTVKLVSLGIDVFDTSYIYIVTDRSSALTFHYDPVLQGQPRREYEINFRNIKFARDFSPIMQGCQCLSCTRYTRAYIHHLTNVQELLGPILLQIHNIHHYMEFFKRIRKSIKDGTLQELEQLIKIQFEEYQRTMIERQIIHVA